MKTFRFDAEHLPTVRRQLIRRFVAAYLVVLPLGLIGGYFLRDDITVGSLVATAVMVTGVMIFVGRKSLSQLEENCEKSVVELRPDALTVRPNGGPGMTVHRDDVQSIEETRNGLLVVRGRTAQENICVSPYVVGFDDLRSELEQWAEIDEFRQTWTPRTIGMLALSVALILPMVLPPILAAAGIENIPSWAKILLGVPYLGGMAAVCWMTLQRTDKRWVRVLCSMGLGMLGLVALGLALQVFGVVPTP